MFIYFKNFLLMGCVIECPMRHGTNAWLAHRNECMSMTNLTFIFLVSDQFDLSVPKKDQGGRNVNFFTLR